MKGFIIMLLFFAVIWVWFAFVWNKKVDLENEFETWTIEDEEAVAHLDACERNKMPPWEWSKANMKQWPCRIDLVPVKK